MRRRSWALRWIPSVQVGGGNPAQWIRRLSGRVPVYIWLWRMPAESGAWRRLEGNMDFDAILEACEAAGTEYLLVEQDNCYDECWIA